MGVLPEVIVVLHTDVEAVVGIAEARAGVEGVTTGIALVAVDDNRFATLIDIGEGHAGRAIVIHEVVTIADVALDRQTAAIREIDGVPRREFNRQQQRFLRGAADIAEVGEAAFPIPADVRFRAAVGVLEANRRGEDEAVNGLEVITQLTADMPVIGVVVGGAADGGADAGVGGFDVVLLVSVAAEERRESAVQGRVGGVAVHGVVVDLRAVREGRLVFVVAAAVGAPPKAKLQPTRRS